MATGIQMNCEWMVGRGVVDGWMRVEMMTGYKWMGGWTGG